MKTMRYLFFCIKQDAKFYRSVNGKEKLILFSFLGILFSPRFIPVLLYRISFFFYSIRLSPVAKFFSLINYFFFGLEISVSCKIGHSFYMPHTRGTVIGAASIGSFAVIYHNVTIGAAFIDTANTGNERPVLGDYVKITTGAVVIGRITIGDNVVIAPNVVIRESVESNKTVGVSDTCYVISERKPKTSDA